MFFFAESRTLSWVSQLDVVLVIGSFIKYRSIEMKDFWSTNKGLEH